MVKRLAALAVMAVVLAPGALAAQTPGRPGPLRQRLQGIQRQMQQQVRRGARAGRITPAELAQLRAEMQALRERMRAIRQSGQRPTPAERQEIRQALMKLRRDLAAATRGRQRIKDL